MAVLRCAGCTQDEMQRRLGTVPEIQKAKVAVNKEKKVRGRDTHTPPHHIARAN